MDTRHYVKACVKRGGITRTERDLHPRAVLCTQACSALLPLPASADGDTDTVLLNFNWKGKSLPGSPLNQHIFGLMVLIKKPWKGAIRRLEALAGAARCFAGTDTFETVVPGAKVGGQHACILTLVFVFLSNHDPPHRCATAGRKCSS